MLFGGQGDLLNIYLMHLMSLKGTPEETTMSFFPEDLHNPHCHHQTISEPWEPKEKCVQL
jgi:hypothetical protein